MPAILYPLREIVNNINTIVFSGGTSGVNVDTGFLLSGEVNLPIPRIEIRDWCIFFNADVLVVVLVACSGSSDGGGC